MHLIRRLGTILKVILEHPDGGLISVPSSETSLEPPSPQNQIEGITPKFEPKKLLQLTVLISSLGSTAYTSTEDEKMIHPKIDGKTVSLIPNQDLDDQRKTRKINQSNSSSSRKNPRPKGKN